MVKELQSLGLAVELLNEDDSASMIEEAKESLEIQLD